MRTVDLIPIILYQLIDGDRYGYEIIKQIEDVSNGYIIIKQPTLYSVLKKLEQGRFISSYWQDSEIGGKRHYYKLTDNGKAQLITYPPLNDLINDILVEDGITSPEIKSTPVVEEANEQTTTSTAPVIEKVQQISPVTIDISSPTGIKTESEDNTDFKPGEVVIDLDKKPSDTPVKPISIFDAIEPQEIKPISIFDAIETESEDNTQEPINDAGNSVLNTDISTATDEETNKLVQPNIIEDVKSDDLHINDITINSSTVDIEKIPFLNYVDFNTDADSIRRHKSVAKHIQKMIFTCSTLLLLLIFSTILCNKYSFSKVYYISAIISALVIILYPTFIFRNLSKIRLKFCKQPFTYSVSRYFFICLSLFLSLIVIVFAYNLSSVNIVADIFRTSNFANFYAPIMLGATIVFDFIFSLVLYKDYKTIKED